MLTSIYNEGLHSGCMNYSIYESVSCLLYIKCDIGDMIYNIDDYRHLTIMNTDYNIFDKIIMNRNPDEKQTCN